MKLYDIGMRYWHRYREQISYLFFGGVTTVINIATYGLLHGVMDMRSDPANVIAWVLAVAVAYVTNRKWVFQSHTRGRALLREMASFVAGRLLTGFMDLGIMHVATEMIGPRFIPVAARKLWDMGVKLASNVLVIVLNYVFSKLIIFRKKS